MRFAWVLVLALACDRTEHVPARPVAPPHGGVARLRPPPVLDLDAADAPYRAAVALQLQPGWGQFLEDCRLRLPASHLLNVMTLATTAELAIDASGNVVGVQLAGSGNADFDRAVRQVIHDAAPLPRPPRALWSDDDRVHLRWLFARDRRQAGPATAAVFEVMLPVNEVTARLIEANDLGRAAKRIQREPAGGERDAAATKLMTAGLREALASSDPYVRRAAVEAVGRASVGTLAEDISQLIDSTNDGDVRFAAVTTAADMGERSAVRPLLELLRADIRTDRRRAVAEAEALLRLDATAGALDVVVAELTSEPSPVALHVLGVFDWPALPHAKELAARFARWQKARDVRVRAGTCAAAKRAPASVAERVVSVGITDRDASVRAACLDTASARPSVVTSPSSASGRVGAALRKAVADAVRDRDDMVRAAAIRALAAIHAEASHDGERRPVFKFPDLSADPSAEVRVAYLRALATLTALRPMDDVGDRVRRLLDDRDANVRAAAWDAFVVLLDTSTERVAAAPPPGDVEALVARATRDPEPVVRRAVVPAITDSAVLIRLSSSDDDGETRTRALLRVAERAGRAGSADLLLGRFASAAPASSERVRTALAWHLAR